jgi:succinoglycan biosynthesis protein ExoA
MSRVVLKFPETGHSDLQSAPGRSILVAIPVLNESLHIETCIRSLMNAGERIREARFVVADGGSTDDTVEIVTRLSSEFPNVSVIANPGRLQSAGVNRVAAGRRPTETILVRCDAHAIYPRNYVLDVADALLRRDVASLATPMDAVGKTCFQKANAWIVDTPLGSGGSAHRGGRRSMFVDHGHHAGFRLDDFLKIGGYDETFSHNEDAEYDTRLRAAGGRIFLDADVRLSYLPRPTVPGLARQYFNYGKGRARTLRKHGESPRLRQLVPPVVFLVCVASLAIAPVFPWALLAPAGYVAALALASVGVAARHRSACGLLAGLASGVMHMSWAAGYWRQTLFGGRRR